jgi:hypothetical protein
MQEQQPDEADLIKDLVLGYSFKIVTLMMMIFASVDLVHIVRFGARAPYAVDMWEKYAFYAVVVLAALGVEEYLRWKTPVPDEEKVTNVNIEKNAMVWVLFFAIVTGLSAAGVLKEAPRFILPTAAIACGAAVLQNLSRWWRHSRTPGEHDTLMEDDI